MIVYLKQQKYIKKTIYKAILNIFIVNYCLVLICSCVGEYQTVEVNTTESTEENPINSLSFEGIGEVVPIADDKIEVYFFPAIGGSGSYSYTVSIGNVKKTFTSSNETLIEEYRGYYRIVATSLDAGTSYTFKVDVEDAIESTVIESSKTLTATTFENDVSDFYGISSVSNATGEDGLDSIQVRWVPTDKKSPLGTDEADPITYEIVAINALLNTPAAINDYSLEESDGKYIYSLDWSAGLNSTTINGLSSGTPYYIFVRVLHRDSINDSSKAYLRSELNNKYIEISTYSEDDTNIKFTGDDFTVSPLGGVKATSNLSVQWSEVQGVFNHFRLFYSSQPLSVIDTTQCNPLSEDILTSESVACKKVSTQTSYAVISDLDSYTSYNVQLVVCINEDCSINYYNSNILCEGSSPQSRCHAITEPSLDNFTGITDIQNATSTNEIGKIFLSYLAPTFEEGYFEGLIIEYTKEKSELLLWLEDESNGKPGDTYISENGIIAIPSDGAGEENKDIVIVPYNIEDEIITLTGLNYASQEDHCFSIYPYIYNEYGERDSSDYSALTKVWRCTTTSITPPSSDEFAGFISGSSPAGSSNITSLWSKPVSGIYTHYEIFYRKITDDADLSFNFPEAIRQTFTDFSYENYQRILINSSTDTSEVTSKLITNLEDESYLFGILTYYPGPGLTPIRSEETDRLLRCDIDSTSTNLTNCTVIIRDN